MRLLGELVVCSPPAYKCVQEMFSDLRISNWLYQDVGIMWWWAVACSALISFYSVLNRIFWFGWVPFSLKMGNIHFMVASPWGIVFEKRHVFNFFVLYNVYYGKHVRKVKYREWVCGSHWYCHFHFQLYYILKK